jgi:hypothetical protein
VYKSIRIDLKDFGSIPASLRVTPTSNVPVETVSVDLGRLYHHYYMDSYEIRPDKPDPSEFEYLRFLSHTPDFRFIGSGPGVGTAKRRAISNEMGQSFCRWFLHDHLGIIYFAHMEHVIGKDTHRAFNGMKITRNSQGDVPDYLCARSVIEPGIAEAKGRFSAISFDGKQFQEWRDQFSRIKIENRDGEARALKGYIVGTRFATEMNRPSVRSNVYAEDPSTSGEALNREDEITDLGRGIIAVHYAIPLQKIGLHLLSAGLAGGFVVPEDLSFSVAVWKCLVPPLEGRLFAGGLYSRTPGSIVSRYLSSPTEQLPALIDLGRARAMFVGLDLGILKRIRTALLGDWEVLGRLGTLDVDDVRPSQLNWLRDGTVTAPEEFFSLEGFAQV